MERSACDCWAFWCTISSNTKNTGTPIKWWFNLGWVTISQMFEPVGYIDAGFLMEKYWTKVLSSWKSWTSPKNMDSYQNLNIKKMFKQFLTSQHLNFLWALLYTCDPVAQPEGPIDEPQEGYLGNQPTEQTTNKKHLGWKFMKNW